MGQETTKSSSFRMPMVELIIIIGTFVIISALLVKLYMGTNNLQKKAQNLSKATIQAEMLAETFKNSADITDTCIYFDQDWNETLEPSKHKIMVCTDMKETQSGRMVTAQIAAYDSTKMLISIDVKKFVLGH